MRPPLIPTLIVAAAVAVMIGLGVWQLQRAEWKRGLLAQFEAASSQPPLAWPNMIQDPEQLYYRRATGFCLQTVAWNAQARRSSTGEVGWTHTASCRTGAEGPGMKVELGWSKEKRQPAWRGGEIAGMIAPDRESLIRLVANPAPAGLQASAPPSPENIPNNHLLYAIQWFLFAMVAAIIYIVALRRRNSGQVAEPPKDA